MFVFIDLTLVHASQGTITLPYVGAWVRIVIG
jgi:hypothetical protein